MNLATFLEFPLNFYSLATLTCVLGCMNVAALSASPSPVCAIIICSTVSCSCCCWTICSKLISCWLIVYGSGGIVGDSDMSGGVGSSDCLSESANPMLDLLPDLYSDSDIFLCKG